MNALWCESEFYFEMSHTTGNNIPFFPNNILYKHCVGSYVSHYFNVNKGLSGGSYSSTPRQFVGEPMIYIHCRWLKTTFYWLRIYRC